MEEGRLVPLFVAAADWSHRRQYVRHQRRFRQGPAGEAAWRATPREKSSGRQKFRRTGGTGLPPCVINSLRVERETLADPGRGAYVLVIQGILMQVSRQRRRFSGRCAEVSGRRERI